MPAYVDTSALVKRYVAEVGSAWVRRLLAHPAQYVIYTSALSQVEVISALQRRVREGSLEVTQAERLAHRVTVHFAQRYQVIALTQAVVDQLSECKRLGLAHVMIDFRRDDLGRMLELLEVVATKLRPAVDAA